MKPACASLIVAIVLISIATASPRIESSSALARHDMQLLRDSGSYNSAAFTWPWPMGRASFAEPNDSSPASSAAFGRITVFHLESGTLGFRPYEVDFHVGSANQPFRSFGYQPRGEFGASIATSWLSQWTAGRLQANFVDDPLDDDDLRLDGSYIALALGNWVAAVDQVERWWGPGWDGSLILSNNARPIPALSLTRISPDPFETKWLSWIGPWTFTTFMGLLDNDEGDRPGSDARLFAMRIDFTPFGWKNLDIGLSRTAQWAGDGRPGSFNTFWRLLKGMDNVGMDLKREDEPGNQLAGIDYRLRIPGTNIAHYGQLVGEDEETYLPDAVMLLFGVEAWGDVGSSGDSWRLYFEWADTRAGHLRRDPVPNRDFDVAYNHYIYQTGYRFKERSIGHSADGDSIMRSLGGIVVQNNGNLWGAKARSYVINRDGAGPHSVSLDAVDGISFEVFAELTLSNYRFFQSSQTNLKAGLHYIDETNRRTAASEVDFGGYLAFSWKL